VVNPYRLGIGLAAAVAGPPLYLMVRHGSLDPTTALWRGGLVAVGCVIGARYVARIVDAYEAQRIRTARQVHHDRMAAGRADPAPSQSPDADGGTR
jgi:hypothetical protein